MSFLSSSKDGTVVLRVYVQPKSSRQRIAGLYDGLLKVGVASPPVDGRANREVAQFLAKCLKIPKKNVILKSGLQSRRKVFVIKGLHGEEIRRILKPFILPEKK
ncbi:MAG: YggU family protein [Deltaproteobacteria bacterium]|nr:YggU family protein [Deltaproteobacteria bacterium]MBW2658678.1 YggU family protein [Deltaproteobacteria bacterium]